MDVSDHKRLKHYTWDTSKALLFSTFLSHRMVFQARSIYLLKKQFILFLTLIAEIKTRNQYCIYNSFMLTKFSNPLSC